MNEQDAIDWAEEAGWEDGSRCAPYSPPLQWGICPEADEAFITAYWHGFALAEWEMRIGGRLIR